MAHFIINRIIIQITKESQFFFFNFPKTVSSIIENKFIPVFLQLRIFAVLKNIYLNETKKNN